jgi:hypothetical protein
VPSARSPPQARSRGGGESTIYSSGGGYGGGAPGGAPPRGSVAHSNGMGLVRLVNAVVTHSLQAPGCNP